jgi:hypothetical protein
MKKYTILSRIFGLLAAAVAALTLWITFGALNARPVLVTPPAAAAETADALLSAVCAGDYDTASGLVYGTPNLGMDREPADEVGRLLWEAFQESFAYELEGECYATDTGIAQNVTMTYLDFSSVTASLGDRSQTLLVQRVAEAEDADTVYDENGDYREDFVLEVLREVTLDALREDAKNKEQKLTLNLVHKRGQWWVVMDQALLSALTGGIGG